MQQVFKQRDDGTIDFIDSIVVSINEVMPDGYVEIPKEDDGKYNDDGRKLTDEEIETIKNAPVPKTELEILKETVDQLVLDNLMRGF